MEAPDRPSGVQHSIERDGVGRAGSCFGERHACAARVVLSKRRRGLRCDPLPHVASDLAIADQNAAVPAGHVVLRGCEVLIPGRQERAAGPGLLLRQEETQGLQPADSPTHGAGQVVLEERGRFGRGSRDVERAQKREDLERGEDFALPREIADPQARPVPCDEEVGAADQPARGTIYLFRPFRAPRFKMSGSDSGW